MNSYFPKLLSEIKPYLYSGGNGTVVMVQVALECLVGSTFILHMIMLAMRVY